MYEECLDKKDQKFKITYEVDIYTVSMNNGSSIIAKEIITKELIKLVNDVLDNYFGFNRRESLNLPNIDENVDRQHLRYEAIVSENDIEEYIIFRR